MERRNFLKGLVAGGAVATLPVAGQARERAISSDAVGMLYDSTKCIGCKSCVVACREANDLPPATSPSDGGLHDMQTQLDGNTKTVIKLYKDPADPAKFAFVKQQCMHCIDPGCVSVCMLGALKKDAKTGIVEYDKDICIGCRYCQVACPFDVPKFEWSKAAPKIVKCELCVDRQKQGLEPACVATCPRQAVIFGKRDALLSEAKARIAKDPGLYQPKVYGEHDLGGTQVLYLSAVPFKELGLPEKGDRSGPSISETIQHGVYQGFITPAVLYAGLAWAVARNWKSANGKEEEGDQ